MGNAEAMSAINPTSLQGSSALIQHQTGIQSTDILRDLGRQLKPCKKLMLYAVLSLSLCQMLPFTKQSPIVRLGECFKTSSITSQEDKFKSPLMLVQSNLADSGSTGSKNVCFGGRHHLQGKGNNTKRQHSGYFLNCFKQSQNNPLLHLCT